MGGRSSSSADSTNTTTSSTASSTGTVGDVVQGQTITINQELTDQTVAVFEQLVNFANNSLELAAQAGNVALTTTADFAKTAAQPDLALVQGYQQQVYYAIGAVALVALVVFFRKK